MTTLLNALAPLLTTQTAKVSLDVSAASTPGELQVIVRPMVGPVSDKASEELRQLKAALAQPIKVVGSPEAIESALTDAIAEQSGKRATWANRAAELDAAIAAAAAKDIKTKKAGAKATSQAAKPAQAAPTASDAATNTTTPEPTDRPDDELAAGFSL